MRDRPALLRSLLLFGVGWLGLGRLGIVRLGGVGLGRVGPGRVGGVRAAVRQLDFAGIVVLGVGPRIARIVRGLLELLPRRDLVAAGRQRPLERAARQLRRIAVDV